MLGHGLNQRYLGGKERDGVYSSRALSACQDSDNLFGCLRCFIYFTSMMLYPNLCSLYRPLSREPDFAIFLPKSYIT